MTTIIFEQELNRIRFKGHAQAGPAGHDLVCAAVSTLAGTLAAALESRVIDAEVRQGDGDITIRAKPSLRQKHDCGQIYLTIASGAELLKKRYPEHVNVMWM